MTKKKDPVFTIRIPYESIESAANSAQDFIEENEIEDGELTCIFTGTDNEFIYVGCRVTEDKSKLKDCFGGYEGDSKCAICFLGTACNLVTNDVVAELETTDDKEDKKPVIKRKAALATPPFDHFGPIGSVTPGIPVTAPPITPPGKITWYRASTGNLTGSVVVEDEIVKITIFPSKFKEGEFTTCLSASGEKPQFHNGFPSEEEAKKYIEILINDLK